MHFICSTFGSSGDVFPMLGLALELRNRGHDVTFATNPNYEELAAQYEIPFEALGTREQFEECINHPDLWHPQRAFCHVFHCLKSALKQQYDLHAKHANSSTVGITNCFGFGALGQIGYSRLDPPLPTFSHLERPKAAKDAGVVWSQLDAKYSISHGETGFVSSEQVM